MSRKRLSLTISLLFLSAAVLLIFYLKIGKIGKINHIILITIDTCRADHLSCYGYERQTTPNLDAIAKEGILFQNCVSTVPLTLPAHSSIFTGTIPPYHGVRDNLNYALGDSNLTISEILGENGYTTGAIIGSFVLNSQFGLDQGFDYYQDDFEDTHTFLKISERRGEEVSRLANQWLEQNCDEQFFLFLHYFDPHSDYRPPEPFRSQFKNNLYAGEIAYADDCIGKVIDKLKELQIYESALIIVVGDHGEGLGEHNENEHSFYIYQSTLKVPFIMKLPFGIKSRKINNLVSLIDIMPTVLSLTGIPCPSFVQGEDLSHIINAKTSFTPERYCYCESLTSTKYGCNSLQGIISTRYKFIRSPREELYDLKLDSNEKNNIAQSMPDFTKKMRKRLKYILAQQSQPHPSGKTLQQNNKAEEILSSLGYVSGQINESPDFDYNKPDAKDYIAYHRLSRKYSIAVTEGNFAQAERICREMLSLYPDVVNIMQMLGYACYKQNNYKDAINYLGKYLQADPQDSNAHHLLGMSLTSEKKYEESIKQFNHALRINPRNISAHANLAATLALQNKHAESIIHYEKALELGSMDTHVYVNYGLALVRLGSIDKAIQQWKNALKIDTKLPEAHQNIGMALSQQGKIDDTVFHWLKSLELKPEQPNLLNDIAWIMATHKNKDSYNPDKAIHYALLACKYTNNQNAVFLNTLASTYAANGQFDNAIETAQQAFELATSLNQLQLAQQIKIASKQYQSKFDKR